MANEYYQRSSPGREFELIQNGFDLLATLAAMILLDITHPYETGSFTIPEGHGVVKAGPLILGSGESVTLETNSSLVIL